jgi:beta-glucosidase
MLKNVLTCNKFLMKKIFFILIAELFFANNSFCQSSISTAQIIASMSLEEKARFVVGTSIMPYLPPNAAPGTPSKPPIPDGTDWNTFFTAGRVYGSAGESYEIKRLGLPSVVYADGPAGLRIDSTRKGTDKTFYCTAFPVTSLLASSWDSDLIYGVGKAMGNEVKEYGVDVLLAPGMNIQRNPLTGRNFEYYSEDPVVAGKLAAAMVKGIQSQGVGTSVKHFAVNNQETFRNGVNAIVSERALREIYLKGFSIVVKEANPWTVMSSYNKINGAYASESADLLTAILRKEWGFKGFVMTDWWAEHDPIQQLKAGNDLLMPGHPDQINAIIDAVKSGVFREKDLDVNVTRILDVLNQTPVYHQYKYSDSPDLVQHATIARTAAADGMVLLKNNSNVLPIKSNTKVALFGNSSYDIIVGGTGSGNVNKKYKVSLIDGFVRENILVDSSLVKNYQTYLKTEKEGLPAENFWRANKIEEFPVNQSLIDDMSDRNDIAILSIGRSSGEGDDRKLGGDFLLTERELSMVTTISKAFHEKGKKVVVVLNIGGPVEMKSWRDQVDGILLAWQPGQEGGNAIADVILGKVNPSGKLATTFPVAYADVPSQSNFPFSDGNPSLVKYKEDIYVGYRYYNTFNVKTAYDFGYGLSYTKFKYQDLKLSSKVFKGKVVVKVKISNIGKIAGKEVVQLYISAPGKSMDKPKLELKKFAKTKLLVPRESQELTFELSLTDLASFDTLNSQWVTEEGNYTIKVGASCEEIFQTKKIFVEKAIIVEKVQKVLTLEVVLPQADFMIK